MTAGKALQTMSRARKVRYLPLLLAFIVLTPVGGQSLFAQEEVAAAGESNADKVTVGPKRLVDYDLPGLTNKVYLQSVITWDVIQLVEFLAREVGLKNIVVSKGVSGLTTKLRFDGVTAGEALEVVLSVNNLAYEIKGGILTIMTDEEHKTLYGASFYDQKKVQVVELKYADPVRVATMIEKIKSAIGTIVADPVTGSLILIDTPEKIGEMQAVIAKADISTVSRVLPTETKTFILQYANVEDMQTQVNAIMTKDIGSVRADKRTKTLIVTDLPHNMAKIEQMIKLFDKSPKQVFLEAKIVETALSDDFSMGVNWQHLFQGLDPRFSLQSVSKPGVPSTPAFTLNYNTIAAGGDLQIVLEALKTVGETRILSNPNIAVLDGQEATIEVVEDQPYKEVTLESGTTNVTGVTYLFKKVGVSLAVTPRINDNRYVSVAVKPEISSISQWYDGAAQEGTPVIRKALAETSVMVKDGVTIIIGGMIKDRRDTSTAKVPVLGSIPLLGRLFRHDTVSAVNTETIVFLTPRIISGDEPFLLMRDMKKAPKPLRPVGGGGSGKEFKPVR
jgi:type II secretory pathway component GspD/PulD (secretin)